MDQWNSWNTHLGYNFNKENKIVSQIKEVNVVQASDETFIVRVLEDGGVSSLTTAPNFSALAARLTSIFETVPVESKPTADQANTETVN